LIEQKIQNYLTKIVNLKREKDEKDARVVSDSSQINQITKLKTDINTMINDSKSKYDLDYTKNMNVNAMQNQYNKHYDFINLLKDKVTPVKNNEKILYNDYSPPINQITTEMNNKILSEPIGLFSEIDTNFITKSQQISDLTQQYNLQRESDKVLKFMGELISK
jgi:folate-dependent tRNA-U54 methylase TrmFO/GidA